MGGPRMQYRSWHDQDARVLPHGEGRYFLLWLACGHTADVLGRPGEAVVKRKCHRCNAMKHVVRHEARP